MAQDRLQKIIAQAGLCSRREAERWISAGKVKVNGVVITTLGTKADPSSDRIEVNGKKLNKDQRRYILFHKPLHCITTHSDEHGRPTIFDHLTGVKERVFPIGRLDFDTEGLLLLTNDGEMAHALMHPASEVPKTYQVKINGNPTLATLEALQTGILLEDGPAQAREVFMSHPGHKVSSKNTWLEMTVTEGRNRLIRRMLEFVKHPVLRLRRVRFAHLELTKKLRPGQWRNLSSEEVRKLKALVRVSQAKQNRFKEQNQEDEWSFDF